MASKWFAKIAAQMSVGVRREVVSPGRIRVVLPWGFPYEAFGSNVVVKPWHILNLVESGSAMTFRPNPQMPGDPFLDFHDLCTTAGPFQVTARLEVSKEMYDLDLPKAPLTLDQSLLYVGNTSINILTNIVLPSSSSSSSSSTTGGLIPLAQCQVQTVLVDHRTRRPSPFPQWWRDRYASFSTTEGQLKVKVEMAPRVKVATTGDDNDDHPTTTNHQPIKDDDSRVDRSGIEPLPPPLQLADGVTTHSMKIMSSDTDSNGHTNWASYLKFCLDALSSSSSSVKDSGVDCLQGSGQLGALKQADLAFLSEGVKGQSVSVLCWADEVVPRAVHCNVVDSRSQRIITYAFLQFYSSDEVQLPTAKL